MNSRKENKNQISEFGYHHLTKTHIVIAVMVLLVTAACVLFVRSLGQQLYEQRVYSLGQTTEKIVEVMNNVIDNEWDRLNYASKELGRTPQATSEQLLEELSELYQIDPLVNSWRMSCIDSNGTIYRWDGKVDRWILPDMLLEDCPDHQITILEARDSGNEQMAFLYRLPEPIRLTEDDVVLTHTLLSLDMQNFGEALEVSAFEGSSFSYITEKNGTRIYHQQNQNEFISAYNILTALQNTRFLYGGSYDELLDSVAVDTPYTTEIEREELRYFVSYAPLSVNNWNLFLFVPEANVGGNTDHFIGQLVVQISGIALLLILLISVFVWNNSSQTLARQQIAVDEAHRASKAKSDFLSHMSHDMRTPLNGIMGMCHIAEQHIGDEAAVTDCLSKINLSSRQLMALINDVLDMSRIEQDKVEIHRKPIDLLELIRTCTVHIEVSVYENGIIFEQNTEGLHHPFVSADPVLVEKVLTNILGNAAKFTPPGGRIWLRASEIGESPDRSVYQFEIEDSGVGMKPEFLDHIFEPFSQENSGSRTKYQGTGLGLSIVKSLVEELGGTITVRSEVGKGSTFTVRLPLDHADEALFRKETQEPEIFDGSGRHVLLVEDNDLNRMIAQTILEDCGLTVDTAENGAIAVECFENAEPDTYDLILMDIRMPVMDGLEASRHIRALQRVDAKQVPIIALTADAFAGDMEKTRQAGMNDHLGKPIEMEKLYAALNKYCPKDQKGIGL